MFRRLGDKGATLILKVDGREIRARDGDTVAAALLAADVKRTRRRSAPPQPAPPPPRPNELPRIVSAIQRAAKAMPVSAAAKGASR